jgi:uncharacterized RDD family membrane protein YckC
VNGSTPSTTGSRTGYEREDLVTGEAVSLELPVAGVALRMASGLIDVTLAIILLIAVSIGTSVLTAETSAAVQGAVAIVVTVGCLVGLPVVLETATRGQTVGKYVVGTRTVRDDGGPITFRHSLVRGLVGFVEIYLLVGAPALVCALVNRRSKRLGDLAAGTYVLATKSTLRVVPGPGMPPGLASWAAAADITPLPDGLAVAARQFLARAGALAPESRVPLAADLRRHLEEFVAPPPPPGHPDELVVAAVLAERRTRDEARLRREHALVARVVPPDPFAPPHQP